MWGCLAKVALSPPKRTRLGPKTIDCVYLGNALNSNAYRFLVIKSDVDIVSVNSTIESRDAEFFEHVFPYNKSETIHKQSGVASTSQQVNIETDEPKRSKRLMIETSFGPDFVSYLAKGDPQTLGEALSFPEAPFWREAINSEMESILHNHTWNLVNLPPGCKTIGCK